MNEQQQNCECEMHESMMAEFADAEELKVEAGHPIDIMQLENNAFLQLIDEIQESLEADNVDKVIDGLKKIMSIHIHYGKKEGLFMPILYQHGVTGPSQVMWSADDEIKSEVRTLNKKISPDTYPKLKERITEILYRIKDMISREEIVFLPLSNKFFTQDEWLSVYRDIPEYGYALIEDVPKWAEGEAWINEQSAQFNENFLDGKIQFDTGEITIKQLQGIFKLLPMDITFIDKDNHLRFFINEGRIFSRPKSALGRNIELCHPPKIIAVIEKLVEDFKAKKRRSMEIWKQVKGKPVAVKYMAVYDEADEYIGIVEFVQDCSEVLKNFANE